MIEKIQQIVSSPTKFFSKLPQEPIKTIYGFYIILLTLNTLLSLIVAIAFTKLIRIALSFFTEVPITDTTIDLSVRSALLFVLLSILIFLSVGITHIYLKLFGAKTTYTKTFQLQVYALTPYYILSWIPVIGIFSYIWALILLIIGSQKTHNLSLTKAIIAFLVIPAIIGIIVIGINISAMLFSSLQGY
jgi:hypothetical protein